MGAKRLPIWADHRDFLDWNRIESCKAHRLDLGGFAGIDTPCRETVERSDRVFDACIGECDRSLGRGTDLRLALSVDQALKPEIEGGQRSASQHCADDDGKYIPARNSAHKNPTPARDPGAVVVSHAAVKTALSLRPGNPNSGAKDTKRVTMVSDGLTSDTMEMGTPQ